MIILRLLFLFFLPSLFLVLLIHGCSRQRVLVEKPSPPERKGVYHVVERHQTLYRISKTYGVNLQEVAKLNAISDPGKIQTGQRVFIPGARKALKVDIYLEDVVGDAEKKEHAAIPRFDFLWPVKGKLSDRFEEAEDKRHLGIDVSAPLGTPVQAAASGKVLYSGNTIRGYGNLVILRHSEEFVTVYAHQQVNLVEEGMWVEKGQVIGKVGQTGRASGPHLHFEIRKDNKAVDPLFYLR